MIRATKMTWLLATAALGLASAGPAYAQATRTWVSGTGDDANPCSRTAPCKTFAGAFSKTATYGEINCIDPGGFGTITITKSIIIDCKSTESGVLASAPNTPNGVIVNTGATDVVVLRGLDIYGVGPTGASTYGVRFIGSGALHIEDCLIRGFVSSSAGIGIAFLPNAASKLFVERTVITDNGSGTSGGVLIQPVSGGSAKAELKDVQVLNNAGYGVRVDGTLSSAGITVSIDNAELSGNTTAGLNTTTSGTNPATVMIANSVSSNNGTGLLSIGSGAQVRVGNTTITGNGTGVNVVSGAISTYGDNRLDGNTNDGAFNPATPISKH